VQAATSYGSAGAYKRLGVNRLSTLNDPSYRKLADAISPSYLEATTASLKDDTEVDWRPRIPQWPAVGETIATAIQASLVGQAKPADALNQAQQKIEAIMKG
jgi:ABC-type glycerol-3-phosphate transport system substrate-binding protein